MKKFHSRASGFSLIEVMIAVVVLAFGLISLAALQARLFQSGAESKARAVATAIAQQTLEDTRSFAFVRPPTAGYTGATYSSLATGAPWTATSGGTTYTVTRTVTRYRYSATANSGAGGFIPNVTDAFSPSVPEFKRIGISVGWTGSDGNTKTVRMTDSVGAIAPADAAMLRKKPDDRLSSPKVYITRPADPQILPIALGDDQDAASSNPKPNQVIQDVAAATTFSVMTYSGGGDTVLLGRKLDVAAVSCLCQRGPNSSDANPVYSPVVWNGRHMAYLEPPPILDSLGRIKSGIRTGIPHSKMAGTDIAQMCTVCCRDHHESADRNPRPDPWRQLASPPGPEHYGYMGNNTFDLRQGLQPEGTTGLTSYVDSCQLIRVGGQLRMAADANRTNLLVTPLSGVTTAPYDVPNFKANYGTYVRDQIFTTIGAGIAGGKFPDFVVPRDSNLRLQAPASPIVMSNTSPDKKLVAFGLYVDYLSPDTLEAYDCVADSSRVNDPTCRGLALPATATNEQRKQAAMGRLPFYAVNVANLGEWRSASRQSIGVHSADYRNGTDGGIVYPADGASAATAIPIRLRMNKSNSGLASTLPVDPDDADDQSFTPEDYQDFARQGGTNVSAYTVDFTVGVSDGINLSSYTFRGTSRAVVCEGRFSIQCTVTYNSTPPAMTVLVSSYSSATIDRIVCVSSEAYNRGVRTVVNGSGATETTTITVPSTFPNSGNLVIPLAVVTGTTCPSGYQA